MKGWPPGTQRPHGASTYIATACNAIPSVVLRLILSKVLKYQANGKVVSIFAPILHIRPPACVCSTSGCSRSDVREAAGMRTATESVSTSCAREQQGARSARDEGAVDSHRGQLCRGGCTTGTESGIGDWTVGFLGRRWVRLNSAGIEMAQ